MKRLSSVLSRAAALVLFGALIVNRASAVPTITTPEVLATTVAGLETGTDNTQFVFRADITRSGNTVALITAPGPDAPRVVIDPFDPANPEFGGASTFPMVQMPNTNMWFVYVRGSLLNGGSSGFGRQHTWSILAREAPDTGGTLMNGTNAAPKSGNLRVEPSSGPSTVSIIPVLRRADGSYVDDKRLIPGQLGNGLRLDPEDTTAPNDGGSAHFYTFRVRVVTRGGLPLQYVKRRETFEWRDHRYDQPPFASDGTIGSGFLVLNYNTGVDLALIDPDGNTHFCAMEIDPEAPNGGVNQGAVYLPDTRYPNTFVHPQGSGQYSGGGVYYRYRMLPTQHIFNWNTSLPGEGPFTAFGGPSLPDSLPAIPIGFNIGQNPLAVGPEIIGRPFANEYVGFAGQDRTTSRGSTAPPFPNYTNTFHRAGQWRYYFIASTDLRPPRRAGFPTNGDQATSLSQDALVDLYGADEGAYGSGRDSDDAGNPVFNFNPYGHPFVGVLLSDGGWTDDLPENNHPGTRGNSFRSRVTTKTRVRFMVRVTKADETPLPLQAVRVYIDDTPHSMQILNSELYRNGKTFYFDTTFANTNQVGQHRIYFQVDAGGPVGGNFSAIWPRRDWGGPNSGESTGDGRYVDPQSLLAPYGFVDNTAINFGTLQRVGKNYLLEPLVNSRPVLSNPSVTPPSGSEGQPFTFEITYTDADNDPPVNAFVVVNDPNQPEQQYTMNIDPATPLPVNYRNGVKYRFTVTLPVTLDTSHFYYFKFRDNWNNFQSYGISTIRREFGEWATLPSGDDNGVPSSKFAGPIITSNKRSVLSDAAFSFSDPAQTSATFYDFLIKYSDGDNQPPANIKFYLSSNGGASYDAGTALVPAESSTNYVTGVLYHLPNRIQLKTSVPVGSNYRYKFVSSDGVQATDTTLIRVGSGQRDNTAHELKSVGGSPVTFGDPNGTAFNPSTKDWTAGSFLLYLVDGNDVPLITQPTLGVDYNVNLANGTVTFNAPPPGRVKVSYFYLDNVGPTVKDNTAPTLTAPGPASTSTNDGTINQLTGTPAFDFKYNVIYTDPDNQPPTYVNVVIDTNQTVAMTVVAGQATPLDYTRGVTYETGKVNLTVGSHSYHFEASDGAAIARLLAAPNEYQGPTVTDPTNLTSPLIQPFPKGKSNDNYTFTITYKSAQGNAPPSGGIEVKLTPVAPLAPNQVPITALLNAIDPIGPAEFMAGVRFQTQLTATSTPGPNKLLPGKYDVTFDFPSNPSSGTAPLQLIVNGRPNLYNAAVAPNPSTRSGDIIFSVTYQDVNGDPPQRPAGGASTIKLFTTVAGVETEYIKTPVTTIPASPTAADFKAGVTYRWAVAAADYVPGTYSFRIEAKDDLEDAIPPSTTTVDGTFTVTAAALPTLNEPSPGTPATNNGTVTPLKGAKAATFTYSVIYKHADNVAPAPRVGTTGLGTTGIQLIIDEGTPTAQVIDLQPDPAATQPYNYANGVKYTYVAPSGSLASGAHTYYFKVADRLTTAVLPVTPGQKYNGPTVNFVPSLSAPSVQVVGSAAASTVTNNALTPPITTNTKSQIVFKVTYTDSDYVPGSPAPTVTVTVAPSQVITLNPPAGQNDFTAGIVFTSDPQGAIPPGAKTFHFDATDQLDTVRLPAGTTEISGLTIANVASLDKVSAITAQDPLGGVLTPLTGPLSTTFTYSVLYMNSDNTPPSFVNLIIDEATNKVVVPLTKLTSGNNFVTGVVYQGQYRFKTGGTHNFRFETADAVSPTYIAKYPADGSVIAGPTVNEAKFADPTFNPAKPTVSQPVTVNTQLITTPLRATDIAVQLVRPDGTGVSDTAHSAADGTIAYTFTPTETGDWRIRFSWAGEPGVYDAVTQEFSFAVTGYQISLDSGQLDMISSPLVPVTPDPTITLGVTDGSSNPLAVTVLNLIKWSPALGQYLLLNQDGNFPGMTGGEGFWVRPSQSVVLNPRGKVVDQTQPFTIPLVTGWNMVGSVYLQDINWSAAKVRVNGQLINMADAGQYVRPIAWTYSKQAGGYQMVTLPDGVFKTGRGYWVHAVQNTDLVLSPPGTRAANEGRDAVQRSVSLQIMARSGPVSDQDNYAPLTSAGNSRLALQEKPPYFGEHVNIRLLTEKVELTGETRAAAANASNVVVFEVETDRANKDVTVQFPNLSVLGRKTEVTLVDLATNTRSALGTTAGLTYNTGDNAKPHRFAVIMNTATISGRLLISSMAASGGNSRSPAISFSYNISGGATVKAQIVGGAGSQVIRTLDAGRAVPQGVNNVVWDGKDNKGVPVASGSYILKITATDDKGHNANGVLPVTVVR